MARRVQEEIEATNARIGNLALLATPHRQNLVAAINDLRGSQSDGANLSADPGNAIGIGIDGGLYCPAVVVSTLHW
jgi:hypothetical protein